MNGLTAAQLRGNADSAAHWRIAAPHRRRVMQLIEQAAPAAGGRVCILGAGNCNDLELLRLGERFAEVTLVDLDRDALNRAVARQGLSDATGLRLHGGYDITGVWDELHQVSQVRHDSATIERLVCQAVAPTVSDLTPPYEVVVSTCVLSQLLQSVIAAVGEGHPRFLEVLAAVRQGHLRLMSRLASPGGRVVLVTDFVSSDSAPEILTTPDEELEGLARRLLERRNFFHGLNPAVLASLWRRDPQLAATAAHLRVTSPWRWEFGVRHYLVTAFLGAAVRL